MRTNIFSVCLSHLFIQVDYNACRVRTRVGKRAQPYKDNQLPSRTVFLVVEQNSNLKVKVEVTPAAAVVVVRRAALTLAVEETMVVR